ncbi:MAG: ABC transporter substrate-binding protein, partial [Halomonas sp.]
MKRRHTLTAITGALTLIGSAATAQTEIQLWHGLGGALGEKVGEIADSFNASQDDYTVVPTYKGTYT